ncbi:MAG: BatD family protein [Verrucomicrobiota bacterium]
MKVRQFSLVLFVLLSVGGLGAQVSSSSSPVTAQARFAPSIVRAGEAAQFELRLSSSSISPALRELELPEVPGLEMQYRQNSSGSENYMGPQGFRQIVHRSYIFRVVAAEPGDYTLPAFEVYIGDITVQVPESSLRVLEAAAPTTQGDLIFAKLEFPREQHYVGEAVPAKLKLIYDPDRIKEVRAGSSRPIHVKEGDAFTVGDFVNEKIEATEHEGQIMNQLSWDVLVTPLKTGPQPLVVQLDLVVATKSAQGSARNDRFMPMFGGSLFGPRYNRERVSIYTDDELDVAPLPTENKPDDFAGGIGMFTVGAPVLSDSETMAGEPITMTLVIRGQGNFDRMEAPVLAMSDDWRDYPPESSFQPSGELGFTGVKTFEYTLIPRTPGEFETPEVQFNFFDPESAQYVELPIAGKSVTIIPNPDAKRPIASNRNRLSARGGPELLPIAVSTGSFVQAIRPVVTHPAFLGAQIIPALLLGYVVLRRRKEIRLETDAVYARRLKSDRAMAAAIESAQNAAEKKDIQALYSAAQSGIQAAAGRHVEAAPESMTESEVDAIAESRGLTDEQRQTLRSFFEASDAIRFGGIGGSTINFTDELRRLEAIIKQLGGDE